MVEIRRARGEAFHLRKRTAYGPQPTAAGGAVSRSGGIQLLVDAVSVAKAFQVAQGAALDITGGPADLTGTAIGRGYGIRAGSQRPAEVLEAVLDDR